MKLGYIPLDERPANTHYPQMIASIAGLTLDQPPPQLLSNYRRAAPCPELVTWMGQNAAGWDGLIVSAEMLGYGGLIASRISHEALSDISGRLNSLRALRQNQPNLPIYAFNLITRISRHNDATEEPRYWAQYGRAIFDFSQMMDRYQRGRANDELVELARSAIPAEHLQDFIARRARNFHVNRLMLKLLEDGLLDLLVLSSDDTSPEGLSAYDKSLLVEEAQRISLDRAKLLMYPGADEVGSVLVARFINQKRAQTPAFYVEYLIPEGGEAVAPFEDGAVRLTVEHQIKAAGAQLTSDLRAADLVLLINPPIASDAEWPRPYSPDEAATRLPHLQSLPQKLGNFGAKPLLLADVAFANGADPELMRVLGAEIENLSAFAAWNTAGNSIGTAIAQGIAALHPQNPSAQRAFLAYRYGEDYLYQSLLRDSLRAWLKAEYGLSEPTQAELEPTLAWIESALDVLWLAEGRFMDWQPTHIRLPWERTFEITFDVEQRK